MASLGLENQRYFATHRHEWVGWLKINVLYAPLWSVRHNRELQLSRAIDIGTLPTRFESFFLIGHIIGNIVYCTYLVGWSEDTSILLAEVRNRTGVMAVVNMVPLFLLAGRNNPLIQIMGVSFDSYNLIHRWLGRIVVIEALTHASCWIAAKVITGEFYRIWQLYAVLTVFSWLGTRNRVYPKQHVYQVRVCCELRTSQ